MISELGQAESGVGEDSPAVVFVPYSSGLGEDECQNLLGSRGIHSWGFRFGPDEMMFCVQAGDYGRAVAILADYGVTDAQAEQDGAGWTLRHLATWLVAASVIVVAAALVGLALTLWLYNAW